MPYSTPNHTAGSERRHKHNTCDYLGLRTLFPTSHRLRSFQEALCQTAVSNTCCSIHHIPKKGNEELSEQGTAPTV